MTENDSNNKAQVVNQKILGNYTVVKIPLDKLRCSTQFQARKSFNEETITMLADSIKSTRQNQPIIVRAINDGYYEIISGENRFRALKLNHSNEAECKIVENLSDGDLYKIAVGDNCNRTDFDLLELCNSFNMLKDCSKVEKKSILGISNESTMSKLRKLCSSDISLYQGIPRKSINSVYELIGLGDYYKSALKDYKDGMTVQKIKMKYAKLDMPKIGTEPSQNSGLVNLNANDKLKAIISFLRAHNEHIDRVYDYLSFNKEDNTNNQ